MILLIGLGNPLWGDHGVGKYVVDSVRQGFPQGKTKAGDTVTAIARHLLSPELTSFIRGTEKVIFVNTEVSYTSGKILCHPLNDPPRPRPYTHDLTPAALLQGVRVLYGRCPPATQVSLTSSHVDFGRGLSRQAHASLPELLSLVYALIEVERAADYVSQR